MAEPLVLVVPLVPIELPVEPVVPVVPIVPVDPELAPFAPVGPVVVLGVLVEVVALTLPGAVELPDVVLVSVLFCLAVELMPF